MKIRILSDLHLEFSDRFPPLSWPMPDADVVVLAGDIDNGTRAIDWAERVFTTTPVLYVPGNHEFYDREIFTARAALKRRAAQSPNLRLLDDGECVINGVRFLGSTLWTDFAVYGKDKTGRAMAESQRYVTDFRAIRHGSAGLLTPAQTVEFHLQALSFLEARVKSPFPGPTVVVTHHAPHTGSIHPKWGNTLVNAAFVSDLTRLLGNPILWIHGHTHDSFDYLAGGTRIVANPMGYRFSKPPHVPGQPPVVIFENARFDPSLVVLI
jgi:Icc-related predicted phosphoesterase